MDGRVNILIVDDQPASLDALEATLSSLGQVLFRAESGNDALRMLLANEFAVVLLDVRMPGLGGFEIARALRQRERSAKTPIIFLTGVERESHALLQAYALGAVDYLVKPIAPEVLKSKVAVFVELAQKTAEVKRAAERMRDQDLELLKTQVAEQKMRLAEQQRQLAQQQMQAALNQKRWLEAILDVMPVPLLLLEPGQYQPLMSNRAALTLLGGVFAHPDLPVEGLTVTGPDGRALERAQWPNRRVARGERLDGEAFTFTLHDDQGTLLAFSERLGALYQHPETVVLSLLDVSELKRTERALKEMVHSQENFIAVGSHELRTPLTALKFQVRNALKAWTRPGQETTPVRTAIGYLKEIDQSVERLVRLSEYLLDVTRLSADQLELQPAVVDLGELAGEVIARLARELEAARVEVTVSKEGPLVGWWDRARLDQVLTNLLENVQRYAPGRPVEVLLWADSSQARVTVRDHGGGLDETARGQLFQRFARGPRSGAGRGFGLGLWIVGRLVQQHGGTIEVSQTPGGGATFAVTLPRAQPGVPAQPLSPRASAPAGARALT